jgi:hypothetical protein
MNEQLLIVGIDPGTTVAFAAIDLNGNIIKVFSQKELPLSSLIEMIIELGKPVLAGCDVTPAPSFAEAFARKTGGRLIYPDANLSVIEKRVLVQNFQDRVHNDHQRDALSSALFAYRTVRPLLKKIDKVLKKEKKEHLSREVKELLLKKKIAIKTAIDIIEKPQKPEVKIIKKATQKKVFSEKDFLTLYEKYKEKEKETVLLKNSNEVTKKQLQISEGKLKFLLSRVPKPAKQIREKISFKERRIEFLTVELEKQKIKIKSLHNKIEELNQFISKLNNNILIKKLDNLGSNEFEGKNKKLNIQKNDILLVDDLDIHSQKIIDCLKDKNITVLARKASKKTKEILPFTVIDARNINLEEEELFASIPKNDFKDINRKYSLLSKIVDEYKETRTKH